VFLCGTVIPDRSRVVVGDFGLAKSADSAASRLGTPYTMAPEVYNATDLAKYTKKADLWSVGVTLYEMLFGTHPWPDAKTRGDLEKLIFTRSGNNLYFPNKPTVSEDMKTMLRKMLTVDVAKRIGWDELSDLKLLADKKEVLRILNDYDGNDGNPYKLHKLSEEPDYESLKSQRALFVKVISLPPFVNNPRFFQSRLHMEHTIAMIDLRLKARTDAKS
jgi:serine/threonine protein kinase